MIHLWAEGPSRIAYDQRGHAARAIPDPHTTAHAANVFVIVSMAELALRSRSSMVQRDLRDDAAPPQPSDAALVARMGAASRRSNCGGETAAFGFGAARLNFPV